MLFPHAVVSEGAERVRESESVMRMTMAKRENVSDGFKVVFLGVLSDLSTNPGGIMVFLLPAVR